MMRRQIQRYGKWLLAIAGLAVLSGISGAYILSQQNLTFPWQDRYVVRAEFADGAGIDEALGQPVNVAGVQVGKLLGSDVVDGRAVARLEIDPEKLPEVYRDARAYLLPRTALKDMQVEVAPGTRAAGELPEDHVIPVEQTTPALDADELTAALDEDTRDFFTILVGDSDKGLDGRGRDMRRLLKALGPTAEQIQDVTANLARRDRELERLVHNLAVLTRAAGGKDRELASLVKDANATVGALAAEEAALGASVEKLPETLAAARRGLGAATTFADELGPTLTALQPSAERLPGTLRAAGPLVDVAGPVIQNRIRPFVRAGRPLARDLRGATPALTALLPDLLSGLKVLTYTVNELAYNPPGDDEGFLYWLAWFAHNGNSIMSTQDAHGPVIRGLVLNDCDSIDLSPELRLIFGLLAPIAQECD